jgi:hypothetical protein
LIFQLLLRAKYKIGKQLRILFKQFGSSFPGDFFKASSKLPNPTLIITPTLNNFRNSWVIVFNELRLYSIRFQSLTNKEIICYLQLRNSLIIKLPFPLRYKLKPQLFLICFIMVLECARSDWKSKWKLPKHIKLELNLRKINWNIKIMINKIVIFFSV